MIFFFRKKDIVKKRCKKEKNLLAQIGLKGHQKIQSTNPITNNVYMVTNIHNYDP
jgi:hypothetical protein